jgi:hypothetical protein
MRHSWVRSPQTAQEPCISRETTFSSRLTALTRGTKVRIYPRNFRAEFGFYEYYRRRCAFFGPFRFCLDGSRSNRRRHERRGARSNARVSIQEPPSTDGSVQPQQRGRGSTSWGAGVRRFHTSCLTLFLAQPTFDRFLRHPWSNLTSTFLNFEGAGSGGYVRLVRPVFSHLNMSCSSQSPLPLPIDVV